MLEQQSPLIAPPGATLLPVVGHIQGVSIVPAKTPKETWVVLQYTDQKEEWKQVNVPFLDAMYLLNLLKAIQVRTGFKMPDDPFSKSA